MSADTCIENEATEKGTNRRIQVPSQHSIDICELVLFMGRGIKAAISLLYFPTVSMFYIYLLV